MVSRFALTIPENWDSSTPRVAIAADVLANPDADAPRLHGPYANHQSVAVADAMDLNRNFRRQKRRVFLSSGSSQIEEAL